MVDIIRNSGQGVLNLRSTLRIHNDPSDLKLGTFLHEILNQLNTAEGKGRKSFESNSSESQKTHEAAGENICICLKFIFLHLHGSGVCVKFIQLIF